jgi:exoribonuclease II
MSTQTATHSSKTHEEPTRYETLKNNVSYLAYGSAAGAAAVPGSLKTRTLLKTTRYVLKYIAFRILRYAKYAVIVSSRIPPHFCFGESPLIFWESL